MLFHDEYAALENCRVKSIHLPKKEKAENLGYGRWLLTSASPDYLLTERLMNASGVAIVAHHTGCQVCIVTLACGHELEGNNIYIKSDLATCKETGAVRLDIELSPPLKQLFGRLPPVEELPYIADPGEAQSYFMDQFQLNLEKIPENYRRNRHNVRNEKPKTSFE